MKKTFLFFLIFFSLNVFSQQRGISYQALIIDPNAEELPGFNNYNTPLVNTSVCLEFILVDENNSIEYSEYHTVTTDEFGMVNLVIGKGGYAGGSSGGWDNVVWSEKSKKLIVNLDTTGNCSGFIEISNQVLNAVPFALYAPGQDGRDGKNAYDLWIEEGNSGTVEDFLNSLKGEKGDQGDSAYDIWISEGNEGSEEDFINSLKGEAGLKSLIKTTVEEPGDNCLKGGVKLEYGLDTNSNGLLEEDEIDATLTNFICDGILIDGTEKGNTPFWDGEKWVVDNNQLFNDGENIIIGSNEIISSSAFTVQSTEKGILIPRLTQEQKEAISNPANGLLVYQTNNTSGFYYFDGSSWTPLKSQNTSAGSSSDANTLIYTVNGF